jgi:hypothetical protein
MDAWILGRRMDANIIEWKGKLVSEELKKKILDQIENTTDPIRKGLLITQLQIIDLMSDQATVSQQIAHDVLASRKALESYGLELDAHRKEFAHHATEEIQRIGMERGARRVWGYVIGGLQAIAIAVGGAIYKDNADTKDRLGSLEIQMARHVEHHAQEERYRNNPRTRS